MKLHKKCLKSDLKLTIMHNDGKMILSDYGEGQKEFNK